MAHPKPPSLDKLSAEYEALKSKATAKIKDELHAYFLAWHKQVPDLKSISWTQFTPYFNDGDTCYFGVYAGSSVRVNGKYEGYEVFGSYGRGKKKEDQVVSKEVAEAAEEIANYIESINGDFLLDAFGDHVEITITPTGIMVEDYEHD